MLALRVIRVSLELLDPLAVLDQQDKLVTREQQALLDLPEHRDFVVRQDRLVMLDHKEILAALAHKDKQDRLANQVSKDNKVRRAR